MITSTSSVRFAEMRADEARELAERSVEVAEQWKAAWEDKCREYSTLVGWACLNAMVSVIAVATVFALWNK